MDILAAQRARDGNAFEGNTQREVMMTLQEGAIDSF